MTFEDFAWRLLLACLLCFCIHGIARLTELQQPPNPHGRKPVKSPGTMSAICKRESTTVSSQTQKILKESTYPCGDQHQS